MNRGLQLAQDPRDRVVMAATIFGELSLRMREPGTAAIRAVDCGEFHPIDRDTFDRVRRHFPEFDQPTRANVGQRRPTKDEMPVGGTENAWRPRPGARSPGPPRGRTQLDIGLRPRPPVQGAYTTFRTLAAAT